MTSFLIRIFYALNISWVRALLFMVSSGDVRGRENVPARGPLILVSNHLNNADPPVVGGNTPREIAWLTKAEWFKTPVIGWMFKMGGMIPVRRFDADLKALRRAQQHLEQGGCLGMFPEGTRSKDGVLHKAEPGTALIALRTGAPIQPIAVWGTENVKLPKDLIGRTKYHLRYGKPFTLARQKRITREDVEKASDAIMRSIAEMLPEKYRGAYADKVDDRAASTAKAE